MLLGRSGEVEGCTDDGYEYTRDGYGKGNPASFDPAKRAAKLEALTAATAGLTLDGNTAPVNSNGFAARAAAVVMAKRQNATMGLDENNDDGADTEPVEEMRFEPA